MPSSVRAASWSSSSKSGSSGTLSRTSIDICCAWTAASNAAWLSVTSGGSGSGSGTVSFLVAANAETGARQGTLTIAGQTFAVLQSSLTTCTYSLSSTSQSIAAAGGNGMVTVTAPAGCTWTATSQATWIAITSGATG
ncbi:MAG: hypothetical protein HYZ74_01865, partial [Elusimicrobia bacterium]|nr:hypothetical protein [Elusimicrobiota bacterium]